MKIGFAGGLGQGSIVFVWKWGLLMRGSLYGGVLIM